MEHLKAALADRYRVDREIGRGGMAHVFLAHDLKLDRPVALKVLRPDLAVALGGERFLREITLAAKLDHPHILPLLDSGDVDGTLFFTMPYVEGESLRDRLHREGQLPLAEAVQLTKEVADALSHAHSRGIIHRDIKPENILLAGGHARVADFGIAKAVTEAGGEHLTETGISIGTPAYMSPEQASGAHRLDGRSDVYSLGCVLYEMLAGEPPYTGPTAQAVLAKKLSEATPKVSVIRERVPPSVEAALDQALAKAPADRFVTASAFAEAVTAEQVVARVGERRWPPRVAAIAAAVVVLAAAWGLHTLRGRPAYERLAVLPPTNLMNDPEQAYFLAGVHNALISELQKAGIKVIARTSVLQYENTQKPIREIAQELDVDALIEASVMRTGDSVEIEVNVVDGRTQEYVADRIVRRSDLRNVVAMYRSLTGAIATEIRAALTPQAAAQLASARPVDPEAYEAYLKGQFHWYQLTPAGLETALHYYAVALERDSGYAAAYAGIAQAWLGLQQLNLIPPREAGPRAKAAVSRALELDSALVEVQYALAIVEMAVEWDWPAAEAAFLRAIELNPNYPDVRAFYSHFLCFLKRPDEAMDQMQRAVELDPFHPLLMAARGWVLTVVGRYDEALAQFQRLLRTVPNEPVALSGLEIVYYAKGMYEEALGATRSLYAAIGFAQAEEALTSGYADGGFRGAMSSAAMAWVVLSRETWVPPVEIAGLYLAAGMDDTALEWLERGFEERDPNLGYIMTWGPTIWGNLRGDPRFQDLLRRMNLPP